MIYANGDGGGGGGGRFGVGKILAARFAGAARASAFVCSDSTFV